MSDNVKRFNLQFNLDKTDEAFAASLLENMGRKKSAIIAQALKMLFDSKPQEIENIKNFDLSKKEDLVFRTNLRLGEPKFAQNKNSGNLSESKPKPKSFVKKEVDTSIINEPILPVESSENIENKEFLDDMLDGLDLFLT